MGSFATLSAVSELPLWGARSFFDSFLLPGHEPSGDHLIESDEHPDPKHECCYQALKSLFHMLKR
jgi:hypothetical protein